MSQKRGLSPARSLSQRPLKKQRRMSLTPAQAQDVRAIAKRAAIQVADLKYTDLNDSSSVTSTGYITQLSGPLDPGVNQKDEYVGSQIDPQSLTLRYRWQSDQTSSVLRTIVFQWFDTATPTMADIIENAAIGAANCLSAPDFANKSQYRILHDSLDIVNDYAAALTKGMVRKVFIPGNKLQKIKFNTATSAQKTGSLWLLAISDDILTIAPSITFYSRITYTDS